MKFKVFGDGVAANLFIYYLFKRDQGAEVIQVFQNDFSKPTSSSSTSVVALNNIKMNVSPLGDLLHRSFLETKKFLKNEEIAFGEFANQYHIGSKGDRKFCLRYPDSLEESHFCHIKEDELFFQESCFLFSPHKFLESLRESNYKNGVKRVSSYIDGCVDDTEFNCVYCLGANFKSVSETPLERKEEKVIGHYLRHVGLEFKESFSLKYHKVNIIYRKEDKVLFIGTSSGSDFLSFDAFEELKRFYHLAFDFFKRLDLELPSYDNFTIESGIRSKGVHRMPFWGKCSVSTSGDNSYEISSLYKNGYSLAFLAAKELTEKLYGDV